MLKLKLAFIGEHGHYQGDVTRGRSFLLDSSFDANDFNAI